MITLTIEKKDYSCPSSYKDITLGQFKLIQTWLDLDHNKLIVEKIINGEVDNEEEALNFYLDFINYVTKIPKKLLMQVKPYGKSTLDELSIQWVFETLSFLLCVPQIDDPKPVERIDNLHFIDKTDLTQAILKDANFIEYQEIKAVQNAFNNLKSGAIRFDNLNLLLAIMYRPKETKGCLWWKKKTIELYDTDKIKKRAEWFNSVDMETVWNCLFFFMKSKIDYLKSIEVSLAEELEKVRHV